MSQLQNKDGENKSHQSGEANLVNQMSNLNFGKKIHTLYRYMYTRSKSQPRACGAGGAFSPEPERGGEGGVRRAEARTPK